MEVPAICGKRPWAYFLYVGSLVMYHADLGRYGPKYTESAIIYWPKQYEQVTHIYLTEGVALAIY
jgi:hypothetical protein